MVFERVMTMAIEGFSENSMAGFGKMTAVVEFIDTSMAKLYWK